jgi:hypothetical protein
MKKISNSAMIGDQGINLIQRVVLEMGFLWYPSGGTEAGIDGAIEIRHRSTGEATNLIIQVQSKATDARFQGETVEHFEYLCDQRDLDYWINGNAPVIFVRSRPGTGEAYWVAVKSYFSDPTRRASRKIVFRKATDRFNVAAASALEALAVPPNYGLLIGTRPVEETLFSNLLPVKHLPLQFWTARTDLPNRRALMARCSGKPPSRAATIKGGTLYAFADLNQNCWHSLCDEGPVERHSTEEWASRQEASATRLFVELLNLALQDQLYADGIGYWRDTETYFIRAGEALGDQRRVYESRQKTTSRAVFKAYKSRKTEQLSYYRHAAFSGHFLRYGDTWFLQINPSYHFTRDGHAISGLAADAMSGMKRLENNQAVHGQVVMWGELLRRNTLFTSERQIEFDALLEFTLPCGVDDEAWLKKSGQADSDEDESGGLF